VDVPRLLLIDPRGNQAISHEVDAPLSVIQARAVVPPQHEDQVRASVLWQNSPMLIGTVS
jgi:hypothetical protein